MSRKIQRQVKYMITEQQQQQQQQQQNVTETSRQSWLGAVNHSLLACFPPVGATATTTSSLLPSILPGTQQCTLQHTSQAELLENLGKALQQQQQVLQATEQPTPQQQQQSSTESTEKERLTQIAQLFLQLAGRSPPTEK